MNIKKETWALCDQANHSLHFLDMSCFLLTELLYEYAPEPNVNAWLFNSMRKGFSYAANYDSSNFGGK